MVTEVALDKICERINKFYFDIRSEVITADLFEAGLSTDKIIIQNQGQHKRSFANDLDEVVIENFQDRKKYLNFKINRDGLYDGLPQSLFHQQNIQGSGISVPSMTKEYKQRKQEEKDARAFFAPLENEFYIQKCFIEFIERQLFFELNDNILECYGSDYLHIESFLPESFISKLTSILPYIYLIAGNIKLTIKCLELLIDEKVSVKQLCKKELKEKYTALPLGNIHLGVNSTLSNQYLPDFPELEITIGPINKNNLAHFLDGGMYNKFLPNFYDFFLPFNVEVKTQIKINRSMDQFTLSSQNSEARLGFSTVL